MSSKSDIWMPIYIGDLLGDTQHLTNEQFGIYHKILYHQWRHGHFSEDEMSAIAGFSGFGPVLESASSTSQAELKQLLSKCLAGIRQMLSKDEAGLLFSRRCDIEKEKSSHNKRVFIERARKGGLAKAKRMREEKEKISASSSASSNTSSVLEGMLEVYTSPSDKEQKQKQKIPALLPPAARPPVGLRKPSPRRAGTSPRQLGKSPRQLGTSLRRLGLSPRQVKSAEKAKPPEMAAVAHPENRGDEKIAADRESSLVVGSGFAAGHSGDGSNLLKTDPRKKPFAGELSRYWRGQNPKLPELRFNRAGNHALKNFLEENPEVTFEFFQGLLKNRAQSDVNPAAPIHQWLRNLMQFAAGPLGKFGKPLARSS